jgi:flagellar basal-body rod protein FlgB
MKMMSDNSVVHSLTSSLVMRALDAATLRHATQAQNIANASTPGYQPLRVNFEEQLAMVRGQLLGRSNNAVATRALSTIQPRVDFQPTGSVDGNDKVKVEEEVAKMMQNAVFYQSLITALGKNGSILRMAVRGGAG